MTSLVIPPSGSIVSLCRSNLGPGAPTVIEWYVADGVAPLAPLADGFFWRVETPSELSDDGGPLGSYDEVAS